MSSCFMIAMGALAVVGVASITKKGRQLIQGATSRVKNIVNSEL